MVKPSTVKGEMISVLHLTLICACANQRMNNVNMRTCFSMILHDVKIYTCSSKHTSLTLYIIHISGQQGQGESSSVMRDAQSTNFWPAFSCIILYILTTNIEENITRSMYGMLQLHNKALSVCYYYNFFNVATTLSILVETKTSADFFLWTPTSGSWPNLSVSQCNLLSASDVFSAP